MGFPKELQDGQVDDFLKDSVLLRDNELADFDEFLIVVACEPENDSFWGGFNIQSYFLLLVFP